jgi:hypothetical protein
MDRWQHVHFLDCLQLIELLVLCKCVEARYWLDLSNWYLLSLGFAVDTAIGFIVNPPIIQIESNTFKSSNPCLTGWLQESAIKSQIQKGLLMQQNQFILRANNNSVNGRVEASRQIHWTLPAMRNAKVVMGWNPAFKLSWMQILHYSRYYMAKLHLKVRRADVAILHQNFWKWTSVSCTTWTQSGCPLQQR